MYCSWLVCCFRDWFRGSLVARLLVACLVPVDRLVDCELIVDSSVVFLVGRLVGLLVRWLVPVDWLVDWLERCLAGWWFGWLFGGW